MTMMTTSESNDSRRPVLVMGIGNLVLQDEGFGVHAVRRLAEKGVDDRIDLLVGGTAGLHLMGYLRNYDHVVVIDAALDSYPAGTLRRLRPRYSEFPPLATAHEIGLKDVIEALDITGFCPDVELIVCGVKKYTSLGCDLSPEVGSSLDEACDMALSAALEKLG